MKTLEEYLIEEGILELFLEYIEYPRFLYRGKANIDFAFVWECTEEGHNFWNTHYLVSKKQNITVDRIHELIEERIPRFRKAV